MNTNKLGRLLSLVLRHRPEKIGITLSEGGWISTDVLINAVNLYQEKMGKAPNASLEDLRKVVATSDKKRFALSENEECVRANQGHSIDIDLGLNPIEPPEFLYHGTGEQFIDPIMHKGLLKMERHAVHLSADTETASKVGSRKGRAIILKVLTGQMHIDGHVFFRSDNGVYLTEYVPPKYIMY